MEYQQCHHRHVKAQWKRQENSEWIDGRLNTCNCSEVTPMKGVKRTPRYYQHHAALTLTLTTITVLLSLHLVLLGDAVGASADVNPQESDKVLLPTLDGGHIAATAGYTVFNASQMHKYKRINDLRNSNNIVWKQSDIQGQQRDQLTNNDVLSDKQKMNDEMHQGQYLQDIDLKQKLKEANKGGEYKDNEPVEKLRQNNGEAVETAVPAGRSNRQLRYFGTTRSPKRRPPYPPRPSSKMKKQVSWFEGSRTFALRASVDARLLIRHAPVPEQGSPWPLPQHYYPEPTLFTLNSKTFRFYAAGESCDILTFAFKRIYRNVFGADAENYEENDVYLAWLYGQQQQQQQQQNPSEPTRIIHMNVTVLRECAKYPSLDMDESYDLEVKRTGASIIAREIWGALRGLETFSQLIYRGEQGKYFVNKTSINDFPRFPHRGILLDTARHFLNKGTIIKNLEAMAQNKMNVFHWHMTDDQSFPFQSKTFPNVTRMGAYDSVTAVYTHEDIAEIIEEARLRGIRVIPEFDTPGHTFSWGYGQDYLLTPCYDYRNQPDGFFGPINPILKATYNFLQRLFIEILAVFPDKYVHLGGDEVPFDCWSSNPHLMNFIRRNNLSDVRDLLSLYERKLLDIVSSAGKNRESGTGYITWQEVVDNGVRVKPDTIVQVWMGDAADVERITSQGLRVIYSTCWYLDYISYGMDWDKYYKCEQITSHLEAFRLQNESLLIGGEACLWTEYADDENILQRLWPRASAAAERLWSSKKVLDEIAAAPRIEEQRCRMIRRGIDVGVLGGPGHCPEVGNGSPGRPPIEVVPQAGMGDRRLSGNWPETEPMEVRASYPQVYVVDMNAMYLVPVLIVVCICCLTLLSLAQDSAKNKIVAILTYPVAGGSRRSIRGLLYIFMSFALIWCIWTAPIWMHSWEGGHKPKQPRSQYP